MKLANKLHSVVAKEHFFCLALEAEERAFSPRVIRKSFDNTGLWPWAPDKILTLTRINAGKMIPAPSDTLEEKVVTACVTVINSYIDGANAREKKKRTYTVQVVANSLHSPLKRIAYGEEELAKAAANKAVKEAKKFLKEQRIQEKATRIALNTCQFNECSKVCQGGKKWFKCENCVFVACPEHAKFAASHMCHA